MRRHWGQDVAALLTVFAACAATWLLPAAKTQAVAGRLSYPQFLVAACATILAVAIAIVTIATPGRRRLLAFRTIAIVGAFAFAMSIWEAVVAIAPPKNPMDNPWYLATGAGLTASEDLPFVRPPHLHWEGLSRGDLAIANDEPDPFAIRVEFATDRDGFRNRLEVERADLVFIGDSFTEAGNVAEDDTFVQKTASRLGVTVRNLGRAGYTAPTELIVLKNFGLLCRPKVVVWQVAESNDLAEAVNFQEWVQAGRPPFPGMRVAASQQWSPTWRSFCRLRTVKPWTLRGTFRQSNGTEIDVRFFELPTSANSPIAHPGWQLLAQAIRDGVQVLRQENIAVVVLLIPMKARGLAGSVRFAPELAAKIGPNWDLPESETLGHHLQLLCGELKVPFVDATPTLQAAAKSGDLIYLPMDTHLSPSGHEVVSRQLISKLTQEKGVWTHAKP